MTFAISQLEECLDVCAACAEACEALLPHLRGEQVEAAPLIVDAARNAMAVADLARRGLPVYRDVCPACAAAALQAGVSLLKYMEAPRVKACVDACLRCAHVCNQAAAGPNS